MANFVLVYTGGGMPATEAERGKVMEAWERFLSDSGEMSSHAVRHLIESSWRRCYSNGTGQKLARGAR